MRTLNLGIIAHIDAGKTSLTERLLYDAGTIESLGSVDAGSTCTDSMELERRRGITIRTNVASFARGDLQVNLIDTPGHPDFIAEVERSLAVLDAAVLVVSAVEGVQSQTVVLWRALRRMRIPTFFFINKIDRLGADARRVETEIRRRLTSPVGANLLSFSEVYDEGTAHAQVVPQKLSRHNFSDEAALDLLTHYDDGLLVQALQSKVNSDYAGAVLQRLVATGEIVLVFSGSALTGAGVSDCVDAVLWLSPTIAASGDQLSALVFKIDRDNHQKIAWLRVFQGEVHHRTRHVIADRKPERITGIRQAVPGGLREVSQARSGEVIAVSGLSGARVGDWLGQPLPQRVTRQFPPPTLEAVVEPMEQGSRGRLHAALQQLADADPLINVRIDTQRNELAVSLYGEVQKEVIASLLADQWGIPVIYGPTSIVHIERIVGVGQAHAVMAEKTTPYLATLGFRVAPATAGTGLDYHLAVERGSMPPAFFAATLDGVATGLAQGRYGWAIPDAQVTLTHSGYQPRQSHMHQKFNKGMSSVGADFRNLAPVLIHEALIAADTVVCEPIEEFVLEIPGWALSTVTALLAREEGIVLETRPGGDQLELHGHIPTSHVQDLLRQLPELASGEAILTTQLDHYKPVRGKPPQRTRVGPDPLDREVWYRDRPR